MLLNQSVTVDELLLIVKQCAIPCLYLLEHTRCISCQITELSMQII